MPEVSQLVNRNSLTNLVTFYKEAIENCIVFNRECPEVLLGLRFQITVGKKLM